MFRLKRIYDAPAAEDGTRLLVDGLWPRGLKRERLRLDAWLKEVAPSGELRHWFAHDPAKWAEFRRRYFAELDGKPEGWQPIIATARRGNVTLLYGARDTEHNNAVALKEYLETKLSEEK